MAKIYQISEKVFLAFELNRKGMAMSGDQYLAYLMNQNPNIDLESKIALFKQQSIDAINAMGFAIAERQKAEKKIHALNDIIDQQKRFIVTLQKEVLDKSDLTLEDAEQLLNKEDSNVEHKDPL